jgi:hypothetical protein
MKKLLFSMLLPFLLFATLGTELLQEGTTLKKQIDTNPKVESETEQFIKVLPSILMLEKLQDK